MHDRRWIWFFAGLFFLAAGAALTPWILNVRQQLTPQQLATARSLWDRVGPHNYKLEYVEKIDVEPQGERFDVEVHNGKVTAAWCDGAPTTRPVWTIDQMFDDIATNLKQDRDAGRKNYTVALFDHTDGHPVRYVRRMHGSHERLEWQIRLEALPATTH